MREGKWMWISRMEDGGRGELTGEEGVEGEEW